MENFTPEQKAAFNGLSNNYSGDEGLLIENGIEAYEGEGDMSIMFPEQGISSFNGEKASQVTYSLQIANSKTSAIKVALLAAMFDVAAANTTTGVISYNDITAINLAGFGVDAVLSDGTIITDVVATAADKKIRWFQEYVKNNPTRVVGMKLAASDPSAFQKSMTLKRAYPFMDKGDRRINFAKHYKANQNQDAFIDIAESFQLDCDTVAIIEIPASTTIDLTFYIGAVAAQGESLQKRADIASANLRRKGKNV